MSNPSILLTSYLLFIVLLISFLRNRDSVGRLILVTISGLEVLLVSFGLGLHHVSTTRIENHGKMQYEGKYYSAKLEKIDGQPMLSLTPAYENFVWEKKIHTSFFGTTLSDITITEKKP